jgi:hypothetical protein
MKKVTVLAAMFLSFNSVKAQKVFSVDYENQADVKVFVVNYENQADLKVYKVKYDYENQAGWKNSSKKSLLY